MIVEMESAALITVIYHFPSLDTLFALAYLKIYFSQQPQFTYSYFQINNRMHFELFSLQQSETVYFVGIVPKIALLIQASKVAKKVIIIDNKTENAIELQNKIRDPRVRRRVEFVHPGVNSPTECVHSVCRRYLPRSLSIPQNLSNLSAYVHDTEQFQFQLPRSREVASGLYSL